MKKSILILLTLTMFVELFACGEDKKNPTEPDKKANIITTVPKSAYIGDTITVVGSNFGESQGTSFGSFTGTKATDYVLWSDNEIVVKVPEGAESGKLWLELNGEKSNEVDFIVLKSNKAHITSINPQSVFISDILTVTGTNFGDTQGTSYISFSGMKATKYTNWTNTEIKVTLPAGSKSGKLWLEVKGEKSNEIDFIVLIKIANIASINPQSAAYGDIITVIGTNFGTSKGTSYVSFAGTQATNYTSWSDNEIEVKVPIGSISGKIWVEVGSIKSNEVDFTVKEHIIEYGTVTDNDGNISKTVKIGNQWWMAENLNVSKYRNGDQIRRAESKEDWVDAGDKKEGAWCYFDNNPANGKKYGKLYNWFAVNDARGLPPAEWNVPTDSEWTELTDFVGGEQIAGGILKEADTTNWLSPNRGATNYRGFTALPGGHRNYYGNFWNDFRSIGYWWSATQSIEPGAWGIHMNFDHTKAVRFQYSKIVGYSVRCIKD